MKKSAAGRRSATVLGRVTAVPRRDTAGNQQDRPPPQTLTLVWQRKVLIAARAGADPTRIDERANHVID